MQTDPMSDQQSPRGISLDSTGPVEVRFAILLRRWRKMARQRDFSR